jgi:hypothetical protein
MRSLTASELETFCIREQRSWKDEQKINFRTGLLVAGGYLLGGCDQSWR